MFNNHLSVRPDCATAIFAHFTDKIVHSKSTNIELAWWWLQLFVVKQDSLRQKSISEPYHRARPATILGGLFLPSKTRIVPLDRERLKPAFFRCQRSGLDL